MAQKIEDKYLYIPIIILLFYFIYELIQYYQIVNLYPIRVAGDLNTYIMKLYQLANYGFHKLVPYTYNGIINFKAYPPGWAFFTLPFFYITKDVLSANFISLIAIYILSFIAIYIICKKENNSGIKAITFFLFLFANPFMLDSILHVGRSSEAFGWMAFLWFFVLINHYKYKELDLKFIVLFTIMYAILVLSHIYILIIGSIVIFSFLLTKLNKSIINKETIKIGIATALGLVLSSFWWMPFSKAISIRKQQWSIEVETVSNLTGSFFSYNTISIIIFLSIVMFYITYNRKDKSLVFVYPLIALALLILTRLIIYLPVLKELPFNIYTTFFIFLSLFYFFKLDFSILKKSHKKVIYAIIVLLPFIFGIVLFGKYYDFTMEYKSPEFRDNPELQGISSYEQTDTDKDVFSIIQNAGDNFIILSNTSDRKLSNTYSVYSVVKYNKKPISGTHPWDAIDQSVIVKMENIYTAFDNGDCNNMIDISKDLKLKQILSFGDGCELLKKCRLEIETENKMACILKLK